MRAMSVTAILAMSLIATGGAQAQDVKTFSSAADVQVLIGKARAVIKPGQLAPPEHILSLPPYNANLEYRFEKGPAAVHENEAEFFYVIEGSGTMITGGKLTGGKRTNPTNLNGDGIDGGLTRKISKGDFVVVPENTPHQISAVDGVMVLMTLHVPRG